MPVQLSRTSILRTTPRSRRGALAKSLRWLLALGLTASGASCGYRPVVHADRATVSGRVTLAGKPLPGGSVTFISKSDPVKRVSGVLQADGTFVIGDVPLGEVLVAIDTEPMKFGAPDRYVKIPDAYRDVKTSGLTFAVAPGENSGAEFKLE